MNAPTTLDSLEKYCFSDLTHNLRTLIWLQNYFGEFVVTSYNEISYCTHRTISCRKTKLNHFILPEISQNFHTNLFLIKKLLRRFDICFNKNPLNYEWTAWKIYVANLIPYVEFGWKMGAIHIFRAFRKWKISLILRFFGKRRDTCIFIFHF